MLRPAVSEKLRDDQSVFSLVVAVARRAREINDEVEKEKKDIIHQNGGKLPLKLEKSKEFLNTKPVKLAVEEFSDEKFDFKMQMNLFK